MPLYSPSYMQVTYTAPVTEWGEVSQALIYHQVHLPPAGRAGPPVGLSASERHINVSGTSHFDDFIFLINLIYQR